MPDISMCQNEECPRKDNCFRYTAQPHEFRQSYAKFEEKDCKMFWPNSSDGETE